jgi:hypothetical protein
MLTVKERAQFVATMRYVHVWLMETLASWVPTTPEMEVKLIFGEHVWDAAQHADALGKRTFELRMPLQHSQQPADTYAALLTELATIAPTAQRLEAIYDVLLPALIARCRRYLTETDDLSDAPTVRILQRNLADMLRMSEAADDLRRELPVLQIADHAWADALKSRESKIGNIVAARGGSAVEV